MKPTTRVYCRYLKWGAQLRRDSTGVSWNKDSEQHGDRRNFIRSLRSPMSPILYVSSLGGAIHAQIDLHCHSRTPSSILCLAPYTLRSLIQIRGITILDQPTEARSTQPCHRGWIFRIQKGPLRLKTCTSALPTSDRYHSGILSLRVCITLHWWHSDLFSDSEGSLGACQSSLAGSTWCGNDCFRRKVSLCISEHRIVGKNSQQVRIVNTSGESEGNYATTVSEDNWGSFGDIRPI